VSLRRMPKTVVHVRLAISLGPQRTAIIRRTYRTCARRRPHRLRPHVHIRAAAFRP
jgi:hypothetical protein